MMTLFKASVLRRLQLKRKLMDKNEEEEEEEEEEKEEEEEDDFGENHVPFGAKAKLRGALVYAYKMKFQRKAKASPPPMCS